MKQSKLTRSARGEECTLQLHPYCCEDPETVVLCHINTPDPGWSVKVEDFFGVYGCVTCHSIIDGRMQNHGIDPLELKDCIIRALYRTQMRMIDKGLLKL